MPKMNSPLDVTTVLVQNLSPLSEVSRFPNKRGLYAFGLLSNPFKDSEIFAHLSNASFIYLGKSESSLQNRIQNTHLSTKRTGSSTLRRTLGALLREELDLVPIPRSLTEETSRSFRNYKFQPDGEDRLTKWMQRHLLISFWEAPQTLFFEISKTPL
jgi:hypothetical protein